MTFRFRSSLAIGLALLIGLPVAAADAAAPPSSSPIATYIVTLRPGVEGPVPGLASDLAALVGGEVTATYSLVLRGFAVRLPASAADALRLDPRVASMTPDRRVHAAAEQTNPTWGLDRSDQRQLPLDGRYRYPARAAAGAHVYVLDTGLDAAHSEFTGRVGDGQNFVPALPLLPPDPNAWGDCNGHGTHVASTAVGTQWGIAKKATVHGVRVLNCNGGGAVSDFISGMEWVAAHHQSPAVVNMSLASDNRSPELDAAARALIDAGISVVASAGNYTRDACLASPAAEPEVLTVGATTQSDMRWSFSNFGSCLDLFAPGELITAAAFGTGSGSVLMSGTSMAAPHVAGAVALVRASRPRLTAAEAQARVLRTVTTGVVTDPGPGSPNRLLLVEADLPPTARFAVRCRGLHCTFNARRSHDDVGITRYRWKIGHRVKWGLRVEHRFAHPGSKRVALRVVDTTGQAASLTKRVTVHRLRVTNPSGGPGPGSPCGTGAGRRVVTVGQQRC